MRLENDDMRVYVERQLNPCKSNFLQIEHLYIDEFLLKPIIIELNAIKNKFSYYNRTIDPLIKKWVRQGVIPPNVKYFVVTSFEMCYFKNDKDSETIAYGFFAEGGEMEGFIEKYNNYHCGLWISLTGRPQSYKDAIESFYNVRWSDFVLSQATQRFLDGIESEI